jgi:hypothetical protein
MKLKEIMMSLKEAILHCEDKIDSSELWDVYLALLSKLNNTSLMEAK